jgi:type II secretory pathway pseudopilin PulG
MQKKALTLLEILISVIILAVTVSGLAGIFLTGKRYVLHSRLRMSGGEFGKVFIDPLQAYVREAQTAAGADDAWDQPNNALLKTDAGLRYCDSSLVPFLDSNPPPHAQQQPGCPLETNRTLAPKTTYTSRYEITDAPAPLANLRRVVTTIQWLERQP